MKGYGDKIHQNQMENILWLYYCLIHSFIKSAYCVPDTALVSVTWASSFSQHDGWYKRWQTGQTSHMYPVQMLVTAKRKENNGKHEAVSEGPGVLKFHIQNPWETPEEGVSGAKTWKKQQGWVT